MTHNKGDVQKIAELNAALMSLNDRSRDSALTILRALSFAQAVTDADTYKAAADAGRQQAAGSG